jgi:hypothetical protein
MRRVRRYRGAHAPRESDTAAMAIERAGDGRTLVLQPNRRARACRSVLPALRRPSAPFADTACRGVRRAPSAGRHRRGVSSSGARDHLFDAGPRRCCQSVARILGVRFRPRARALARWRLVPHLRLVPKGCGGDSPLAGMPPRSLKQRLSCAAPDGRNAMSPRSAADNHFSRLLVFPKKEILALLGALGGFLNQPRPISAAP